MPNNWNKRGKKKKKTKETNNINKIRNADEREFKLQHLIIIT